MRALIFILICCLPEVSLTPSACKCQTEEELQKSTEHLQLVAKISAMKMVPSVRFLIHQSTNERDYILNLTKYEIVRDLQDTYGKLITHTDFHKHFVELIGEIRRVMSSEEVPALHSIQEALTEAVDNSLSKALPSAFLCLSMGECLSAPPKYVDCMSENAHKWTNHFGKEPEKMTRRLAETIGHYKHLEKRLLSLQELLIGVEKSIGIDCVKQYSAVTQCGRCVSSVNYCRDVCQNTASDCFLKISEEWDEHVSALEHLSKDYDDGFIALERGIHNSLRRLVEVTSPNLARDVVNSCGTLGQGSLATAATPIENVKPITVARKTQSLVNQILGQRGYWRRLSEKLCSEPSMDNFCWNGTNIVRTTSTIEELPEITKNVRPRPKDPLIEGSGSPMSWSDDEDLSEGSGSGAPAEETFADIFATTPRLPITPGATVGQKTATATTPPLFIEQNVYEVTDTVSDSSSTFIVTVVVAGFSALWIL